MHHYYFANGPWTALIGIIILILAIIGLITFVNGAFRAAKGELSVSQGGSKPLAILEERYAAGEISSEEFEKMRLDLVL